MSRAPSTFRQGDVTRAAKAAKAAGLQILRIEFSQGKFALFTSETEPVKGENEWDRS